MTQRNHKKRHGVNRERSRFDRLAYEKRKRNDERCLQARRRRSAIARLYWGGLAPDLATAARMVDEGRRSAAAFLARLSAFLARPTARAA